MRRRAIPYGPLFGLALALMSPSAKAQCWYAGGTITGDQKPSGRLDGETYDTDRRAIRASWHSEEVLPKCSAAGLAGAIPNDQLFGAPSSNTGAGRQTKATTPESKLKPPDIIASPVCGNSNASSRLSVFCAWPPGSSHAAPVSE